MAPPRRGVFTPSGLLNRFFGSAISNAAGYAIGGAIIPVLEPLTRSIANEAWAKHPVYPISAGTIARAGALGIIGDGPGSAEASLTGYDATRYGILRQLAQEAPSSTALLELHRRGLASDGELEGALERNGMMTSWRGKFAALTDVLPSVTDMVRFAVREVFNPAQRDFLDLDSELPGAFVTAAKQIGIPAEQAANYWAAHWELPSYTQGTEMLFRGEISESEFSGLLKALDYAPTWRPKLEAIARRIPPITDMIRFAVREVYSPAQRAALGLDADYPAEFTGEAKLHGMDETRARQYWAAHWRLPSAQQGYRMLWRGEINEAELEGLLKALDYPLVWRDRLANIAHLVPGRVDLRRMLAAGVIDRAQVRAGYIRLGYTPAVAELLTAFAEHEASKGGAAESWASKAHTRLFTVAHNEYLDASLDDAGAHAVMTEIGVTAAEQTKVLAAWAHERSISRLELTPAQIKKAYTKGAYPIDMAVAELGERGMTDEDARTFLTT